MRNATEFMQFCRSLPALPRSSHHPAQKRPSKVLPVHQARTFRRLLLTHTFLKLSFRSAGGSWRISRSSTPNVLLVTLDLRPLAKLFKWRSGNVFILTAAMTQDSAEVQDPARIRGRLLHVPARQPRSVTLKCGIVLAAAACWAHARFQLQSNLTSTGKFPEEPLKPLHLTGSTGKE